MPLTLLLGPANCGKVALLLDRFAEQLDAGAAPFLVVPTRPAVELAERDLLARRGVVLGGSIGTFDDLFERALKHGFVIYQGQGPLRSQIFRVANMGAAMDEDSISDLFKVLAQ